MSLDALYNRRILVKRASTAASTVSAAGAVTWNIIRRDIPCRMWPASTYELDRFGKTTAEMTHVMACAAGTDLRADDLVFEGATKFAVTGPPLRMDAARLAHHLEVPLLQRMET